MKKWLLGLAALALAGCAGGAGVEPAAQAPSEEPGAPTEPPTAGLAQTEPPVELENLGPAPELENEIWLNTEAPLRLADLRGQVVLLEMWTFGCINCKNVIPSLRGWHADYGPQGLVVIGNHYPEFEYEADLENLREAIQLLEVPYPVAQDNEGKTWQAYENHYWPALFLIDKRGDIRYQHIGEGAYEETEAAILALLAEPYP